jgi:hypothetical protein
MSLGKTAVVAQFAKQISIHFAIPKSMSSRAAFARDLTSDRSAYAADGSSIPADH